MITAITAKYGSLGGDKLYQKRARLTLPLLVRQAKARQTIYYSELATELNFPNPRSFNYILGAIGNALQELSKQYDEEIPPIQCIVINKNNELPGEGVGWFIKRKDFSKITKARQRVLINAALAKIYTYGKWDWVLDKLHLEPLEYNLDVELEKARKIRGGGESEDHKRFKEWISQNPQAVKLKSTVRGSIEHKLVSGDCIDVLFIGALFQIAVEVKSKISKKEDILWGIFQCVKYKKLLEAEQIINNELPNSLVILALEGRLPEEFISVKNRLGVDVIDEIIVGA